jgi:hypothetical protein
MDQHSSPIDQATLARFITEGFFLSHIKRMRKIYAERRDFFIKQFNELLGDRFTLQVPEAGLNIVAWLKREEDFPMIKRITSDIGVRPSALSFFCIQAKLKPAFVFGFAAWTPTQIRESLVKLASALRAKISQTVETTVKKHPRSERASARIHYRSGAPLKRPDRRNPKNPLPPEKNKRTSTVYCVLKSSLRSKACQRAALCCAKSLDRLCSGQ